MRKSVKILFGLFVCLAATTGHAQKIASENGKVIIDSSAIPHVTTKKSTDYYRYIRFERVEHSR